MQGAKLEAQIEILNHLKIALCVNELSNRGRRYIDKLIKDRKDDLGAIKSKV